MNLTDHSTSQLRKRKDNLSDGAAFGAAHAEIPESMDQDWRELIAEIEQRERAYEAFSNKKPLESVVDDWFTIGSPHSTKAIMETLGLGWTEGSQRTQLIVNPRNLFFDEIIVTFANEVTAKDYSDSKIKSATFVMRHPVDFAWVDRQIGELSEEPKIESGLEVHTMSTECGAGPQHMEFAFERSTGKKILSHAVIYAPPV